MGNIPLPTGFSAYVAPDHLSDIITQHHGRSMLQTWIHHIKPGKEDRLRAWLGELNTRADEVRASFAAAGVRAEQAFVVPGATGSLLLYVSETDHPDHAEQVFENSTRTIDIEHRAVMEECIEDTLNDAPNYDVGW